MMNSKHHGNLLLLVSACLAFVLLLSCSDNASSSKSDGTVAHDGKNISIKMYAPDAIAALAISDLQAEVIIDQGNPYALEVNQETNAVSGRVTNVPAGIHDLEVVYFVTRSDVDVVLCTFSTRVTVVAGQSTSIDISDEQLNRNIDDDNDGYTNLAEVRVGTDPLSVYDFPGSGSPIVIAGNGIIQTSSSKNYTIKQIVGSAVAGKASSDNFEVVISYVGDD